MKTSEDSCYGCAERYIGCHSSCIHHKRRTQARQQIKQKIREERCIEYEIYLYNKSSAGMR